MPPPNPPPVVVVFTLAASSAVILENHQGAVMERVAGVEPHDLLDELRQEAVAVGAAGAAAGVRSARRVDDQLGDVLAELLGRRAVEEIRVGRRHRRLRAAAEGVGGDAAGDGQRGRLGRGGHRRLQRADVADAHAVGERRAQVGLPRDADGDRRVAGGVGRVSRGGRGARQEGGREQLFHQRGEVVVAAHEIGDDAPEGRIARGASAGVGPEAELLRDREREQGQRTTGVGGVLIRRLQQERPEVGHAGSARGRGPVDVREGEPRLQRSRGARVWLRAAERVGHEVVAVVEVELIAEEHAHRVEALVAAVALTRVGGVRGGEADLAERREIVVAGE